jgi:hypothetical protein
MTVSVLAFFSNTFAENIYDINQRPISKRLIKKGKIVTRMAAIPQTATLISKPGLDQAPLSIRTTMYCPVTLIETYPVVLLEGRSPPRPLSFLHNVSLFFISAPPPPLTFRMVRP